MKMNTTATTHQKNLNHHKTITSYANGGEHKRTTTKEG
jgi:hypothetical protein